jgi:hypothetical protein
MSLVRVGMSDNKKVSAGWEAVFASKRKGANKMAVASKPAATKVVTSTRGSRVSKSKQKGK